MDVPSSLPTEPPNGGGWPPNGYPNVHPNGPMCPPPPYYAPPPALPPHMQQHRPGMPSTSNAPPYGYPPMDQPNGFYPGAPNCGPMPPNMPMGMPMQGMPPMSNGDFHPPPIGTPNAHPPRVSSSGPQARASPFTPQPMPPNGAPMMPPYAGRPLPPAAFYPNGMPAAPPGGGFVFTSEMANQAAGDVQQGKLQNVVQWHCSNVGAVGQPTAPPPAAPKNARNSPSYATATGGGRKRKQSQAQPERQNPTPSPQLNPPGSVPEFKQPLSNHAPPSVPASPMMPQYPMGGMQPLAKHPKTDTPVKHEGQNGAEVGVKAEVFNPNSVEAGNPIKKLEQMANSGDIATKPTKPPEVVQSREEKLAKLDQIKNQLLPQQPPSMYPAYRFMPPGPNGVYYGHPNGPPGMMPQPGPYGMMPPASTGADGMPPGYMMNAHPRYPMMPVHPNGMPVGPMPHGMNGVPPRMAYPPMPMNMPMPRPPNGHEMYPQWQSEGMPQSLANLDSRVPSQKIQYYPQGQPPPMGLPPGSMSAPTAPSAPIPS